MPKSTYTKPELMALRKRQYKNFTKESFFKDLKFGISNDGIFSDFKNEFEKILDHNAPGKQAKLLGNTKHHVNKILRKEIMKRSRLKNKTNKTGSKEDLKLYKIQRSVVTKLNIRETSEKKEMQKIFGSIASHFLQT